jgi:hypothetical protein
MLFRPELFQLLLKIVQRYPDELLSYTYDRVHDYRRPIVYAPVFRSGLLFRTPADRLLKLSSRMTTYSCLPRMLNCIVPRAILEQCRARFGNVFSSWAPDFCFCYRTLALVDSILYFDKSVMVSYAQDRSNGAAIVRGIASKDSVDFLNSGPAATLNAHTPLPGIVTIGNAVANEYGFVRSEFGTSKFPPLQLAPYLDYLANEVLSFEDRQASRAGAAYLKANGWSANLGFYKRRWQSAVLLAGLSLVARKFDDIDAALAYALRHPAADLSWLPVYARRYGPEVSFLPR